MPDTVGEFLPRSTKAKLYAESVLMRVGDRMLFRLQKSVPPQPHHRRAIRRIDSTLSKAFPGRKRIRLDVWAPNPEHRLLGALKQGSKLSEKTGASGDGGGPWPCVIDVHGGGFTVGKGKDDARFASLVVDKVPAVVVSVSHRRGPHHPFPTAVEDVADAVLYVTSHAGEFNIDPTRIVLNGFSSGATCVLAAHYILTCPSYWGYTIPPSARVKVAGIVAWYPLLDNRIDTEARRQSCVRPDQTLTLDMVKAFFQSYVQEPIDASDPRLSPGCGTDEMLDALPPLGLQLCEYDMFHAEGLDFAHRLAGRGHWVRVRTAVESLHGWDKPTPIKQYPNVQVEYDAAVEFIKEAVGRGGEVRMEKRGLEMDQKTSELDERWTRIKKSNEHDNGHEQVEAEYRREENGVDEGGA